MAWRFVDHSLRLWVWMFVAFGLLISPLIWRSPGGAGIFGGLDMADCSFDSIQLLFGPFGLRKLLVLQFLQRWLRLGPLWLLQCVYRGSPLAAEFWHGCFTFTGARGLQVHFASCSTS